MIIKRLLQIYLPMQWLITTFTDTDNSEAQPTYHAQSKYSMLVLCTITWYRVTIRFWSRKSTLLPK